MYLFLAIAASVFGVYCLVTHKNETVPSDQDAKRFIGFVFVLVGAIGFFRYNIGSAAYPISLDADTSYFVRGQAPLSIDKTAVTLEDAGGTVYCVIVDEPFAPDVKIVKKDSVGGKKLIPYLSLEVKAPSAKPDEKKKP